jgi:hypothetical protein
MPNLSANGLSVSGLSISGLKATAGGSHEHTLSGGTTSAGNHQHDAHTGSAAMMISSSQSFTGALSTSHSGPSDGNSGDTRGTRGTLSINATHNLTGVHEHSFSSSSKAVATPAHEHDVTGGTISGGTISGNITSGSISGSTADAGSGLAFSVETLPVYYTVIYIMKVV